MTTQEVRFALIVVDHRHNGSSFCPVATMLIDLDPLQYVIYHYCKLSCHTEFLVSKIKLKCYTMSGDYSGPGGR